MNKGIRFTDEFKRVAVAQVVERGYANSRKLTVAATQIRDRSSVYMSANVDLPHLCHDLLIAGLVAVKKITSSGSKSMFCVGQT